MACKKPKQSIKNDIGVISYRTKKGGCIMKDIILTGGIDNFKLLILNFKLNREVLS